MKLDEIQSNIYTKYPSNHYLSDSHRIEQIIDWTTFYRRNINRFVQHYFGLTLHLYQHIILYLMNLCTTFCMVASRASAKSYIIAIYACAKAVLYPGSKIVIASGTKGQSKLIVSEKIKNELMSKSYNLNNEIEKVIDNQNDVVVVFKNTSTIKVVPAAENARGNRGTVVIYEEFRQIEKKIADSILSPFLIVRMPPYLVLPQYSHLTEEPMEIYISSSWFRSHWMWNQMKIVLNEHYRGEPAYIVGMDYAITLKHNIKTAKFLRKEKKKLDPISWAIEYENHMIAENTRAYFSYDILSACQKLKKAFYPRNNLDVLSNIKNKYHLPKQDGEIRVISCDIAMIESDLNDNSVFSCIRLLPEHMEAVSSDSNGVHVSQKQGYRRQVPYIEAMQGGYTEKQAIRIKQLYEDFDADYCVLDIRNSGINVYDALAKILYDDERDVEYKPWSCMNDEGIANRIQVAGALKNVYAISANARLNSEIAVAMRECFVSKRIDLLLNHNDAIEEIQKRIPEYNETLEVDVQIFYEYPYLETVALVNEMLGLEYEVGEQTGYIRIKEPSGCRKDRYTSISYGNYFACLLEQDLFSSGSEYEYVPLYN